MQVAVTGSSGLIGTALCSTLRAAGHRVVPVVRRAPGAGEAGWDPASGEIDAAALGGVDAVVHLAGAGIGDRRLTSARRRIVRASRLDSTALLARTLVALDPRPRVLVTASAIGFYGDRGDEILTETSGAGAGFLAELCRQWEAAAAPVGDAGIRLVTVRMGVVLSAHGGALGRQLPLFRLGLGGRLGSGRQWTSWISLHDAVRAITFALDSSEVTGAVNVTAPVPVANRDFTAALAAAVGRPARLAVPRPALTAVLGRSLTAELVLASQRVVPAALDAAGFAFDHPGIDVALAAVLGPRAWSR